MTRPSLRANGSRERAPDDRLREAIQEAEQSLDCFVALLLAMTKGASRKLARQEKLPQRLRRHVRIFFGQEVTGIDR
jgi:hypothetical protein